MHILFQIIFGITVFQLLVIGTIIFLDHREPGRTVSWLLILGVLPVLGVILYLVFGRTARSYKHFNDKRRGFQKKIQEFGPKSLENVAFRELLDNVPSKKKLMKVLSDQAYAPLTLRNRTEVLTDGVETFNALFTAFERASHHIHVEYYIFKDDQIGHKTQDILMKKAKEGLEVRLILDGLGSRKISHRFDELKKAGVQVEWFFPMRFPVVSSRLSLRNHRKIVIIDGEVGFLGGLNVGDEYLSRDDQFGFWRDTFVKIKGEAVHYLQMVFLSDWAYFTHKQLKGPKYYPQNHDEGNQPIQIAVNGPDTYWESGLKVFFTALTSAQKNIYIETPYFIPDESTLLALKTAALSGLEVKIIMQGIPDHQLTFWASLSYIEELLEAGVHIYLYQKGLLHAKVLIIDDELGCVGSANFDIRSFKLNFELSAFVYQREFAQRLVKDFRQDILESDELLLDEYRKRPFTCKVKESGARLFSPLL